MSAVIYNVTININHQVHDEWFTWMLETHIPEVMEKGIFTERKVCRLLGDEDSGGVTYAIQYTAPDMESYLRYQREFAPELQKKTERFKDQFVAFRSVLKVIA